MKTILGRKVGMTRAFIDEGVNVPVTVIAVGPCFVSQIKTPETDGYSAVQLAFEDLKPRRSTMQQIGHDAKAGIGPKRFHREVRLEDGADPEVELGQEVGVDVFEGTIFVDVVGTSKGKGFQGGMKRYGFKGQLASHGVKRRHRSIGSICGHAAEAGKSGGMKKGKKMPGRMGGERVTARNLEVIDIDKENNLLVVKGAVPGPNNGFVIVRTARRLWRSKANRVAS